MISSDIFIKFEGIDGESQDSSHPNEIQVLNMAWGMDQGSQAYTGLGSGHGRALIKSLVFDHMIDCATPLLFKYAVSGKPVDSATLTVRKAGGSPLDYYKVTLNEVLIESLDQHGTNAVGSALVETVRLSFAKMKMEYQPQGPDGSAQGGVVSAEFDIKKCELC